MARQKVWMAGKSSTDVRVDSCIYKETGLATNENEDHG